MSKRSFPKAMLPFPRKLPEYFQHGPPIYTCNQCGTRFDWHMGASWFGSIKEWDEGDPLLYACSDPCRELISAALGYPDELPIMSDEEKETTKGGNTP